MLKLRFRSGSEQRILTLKGFNVVKCPKALLLVMQAGSAYPILPLCTAAAAREARCYLTGPGNVLVMQHNP